MPSFLKKYLKKPETRFLWPDAIKAIAIFMVVFLHTSSQALYSWDEIPFEDWYGINILGSIARVSVPLFVMVSGGLLLHKNQSYQVFFKKRLVRVLFPWLWWGTVMMVVTYGLGLGQETGDMITNLRSLIRAISRIYLGGFWFMPMIVGLYLLTPLVRKFVSKATNKDLSYFFILWYVLASVTPTLRMIVGVDHNIMPMWLTYLGYYIGGYAVIHRDFLCKNWETETKWRSIIVYLVSVIVTVTSTFYISAMRYSFVDFFYNYLSINVVIMSFASFVLITNFFRRRKFGTRTKTFFSFFGKHSYGIFLSHSIILTILFNFGDGLEVNSPYVALIVTTIVFLFSGVMVAGLKRFPIIRNFAG